VQDIIDSPEPIYTASEAPSRALQSASTTDILRIAESAGLQQDGRWFQRLGSTICQERTCYNDAVPIEPGAVEADSGGVNSRPDLTYDDAVGMYLKALEIDSSDAVARSGMALALAAQEKYEDAARETKTAVERFSEAIRNGEKSPNPEYSLLKYEIDTQQDYATFCMKAGNPDEAFRAYQCAIRDLTTFDINDEGWERMVSAAASYFYDLTSNKKWADAELLLRRLNSHTHRSSEPFHLIYQYMAYNTTQLLQIGYYTKNLQTLTEFMNHALSSTARQDDDTAVASVVHNFANILFRLDNERVDEAVSMLEAVVGQSHTYDYIKGWAERELARHFLTRILQERQDDHWQAVARYVEKLIKLVYGDDPDPMGSNTESRDCGRMLAAWYQLNGLQNRAMQCVRSDVTLGIDLLSDTDPDNDTMAWHTLMDSLLAVGDEKRAVAAVNMLRSGLFQDPKPSGKSGDVAHAGDGNTAKSDDDTLAGAANDLSPESSEAQDENALPPTNEVHADQTRNIDTSNAVPPSTSSVPVTGDTHESGQGHETETSKSEEATPDPGYPFFGCDGCCFDSIANDAPMWRCSCCITDFCESCHRLIMDKNMAGWNVCDSLHRHVYVPGVTKKYPKDMIKVGDEEMTVAEWVQGLRKDWEYFKAGS
jgi:tetratricopeptide (TPR) repeat protein